MCTTATHQFKVGDMVRVEADNHNHWIGRSFDGLITFVNPVSKVAVVHNPRGRSEQVPLRYLTLRVGSRSYFEGN